MAEIILEPASQSAEASPDIGLCT